jgi:hypothetical protein
MLFVTQQMQAWQSCEILAFYPGRDCEGIEYIPGSHFVKAFSALPSHS